MKTEQPKEPMEKKLKSDNFLYTKLILKKTHFLKQSHENIIRDLIKVTCFSPYILGHNGKMQFSFLRKICKGSNAQNCWFPINTSLNSIWKN